MIAILCAIVLTLQPIDWTLNEHVNGPTLTWFALSLAVPLVALAFLFAREVVLKQKREPKDATAAQEDEKQVSQ